MPLIDVHRKAPAFSLKDQFGKSHSLKDYHGRIVVLYFYPKDMTSGCTKEACQFRDHHPEFSKIKAVVLGVSPDDAESHRQFVAEHLLPFTLLTDTPNAKGVAPVCDAYGTWQQKSMYGQKYMGVERTTYLIDPQGRVARRWDRVSVPGHVAEVLEAVKLLHAGEPLVDPDDRPVKLTKAKHRKTSRSHDTDPQYTPIRGPGNRSTAGPSKRAIRRPVPKVRASRAPKSARGRNR